MGFTRVVVFVDYQNAYRAARRAFHDDLGSPAPLGQFHPDRLGEHIAASGRHSGRVLDHVRVYRGMPDPSLDNKGYGAARRQVAVWRSAPNVDVTVRSLRYPRNYQPGQASAKPQEKGIDVQIAVDFVLMAVRGEYDVGVLMSLDTDLRPAIEAVLALDGPSVEVAAWQPGDSSRQRYRLKLKGGPQPRCNWIAEDIYRRHLADRRDYNRAQPRHRRVR